MAETSPQSNNKLLKFMGKPKRKILRESLRDLKKMEKLGLVSDSAMKKMMGEKA